MRCPRRADLDVDVRVEDQQQRAVAGDTATRCPVRRAESGDTKLHVCVLVMDIKFMNLIYHAIIM